MFLDDWDNINVVAIFKSDKKQWSQFSFFSEIRVLVETYHPAILSLTGFSMTNFKDEFYPTILTPFMKNGSLRSMLDKEYKSMANHEWSITKKQTNIFGIAIGIYHLHQK